MSVLSVLSGLSSAAGQGYQGYAADEQIKAKELLAQAKASQEADRNRVLNLVGMAGIDPTTQGKIAGARAQAQVAPHIAEAGGKVTAETPGLVAREIAMAPAKAATAGAVAQAQVDPHVSQATQIEKAKPDHMTPVVTTAPDGSQRVSSFDTETGGVTEGAVTAKAGTAGGAGDVMAKRASAALPQIDAALKNFDQYHEPGAAGRLFVRSALGGWAISPEGQRANQAADAIATAYAGAKSRSGTASMATIQGLAQQIKVQTGEGDNPELVAAKIARAHAWRDEIAQLGGSNHAAGNGGTDKEFDALMSSLTPKKKP